MDVQVFQDIPRWYTAIAEWCACVLFISVLNRRYKGWKLTAAGSIFLILQIVFLRTTEALPTVFWLPCMLCAVGLMLLFMVSCCPYSWKSMGYYCAGAFLIAEFVASLEWQLHCYLTAYAGLSRTGGYLLLAVVFAAVYGVAWYIERSILKDYSFSISARETGSALLIAMLTFAFSNLSFILSNTPFTSRIRAEIFNIRTLTDLGGVVIFYAYQSRISELNIKNELLSMQSVLKKQYSQYRYYQDSMEIIGMKYHDLKHQIDGLRAEEDPGKRKDWLDNMEKELQLYEIEYKTGNTVLDTILNSKSLYCRKNHIRITCVADGEKLQFMSVADICTIFGNAFDNAIESVSLEPDTEKRQIHVSVSAIRGFLSVRMENYCSGDIKLVNGFPYTTKANKRDHGFGLKSIRYTVEKYGGNLTVQKEDDWFVLKILVPII